MGTTRYTNQELDDWLRSWLRIPPRYAVNLIRLWKENNVIVVYIGGGLDQPGCSWGLNGPSYYSFGKAMEHPSRDADELQREYIEASFGVAAEPMDAFFTTMHRRMEARQLLDRHETGNPDRRYRGFPFETYPSDYFSHFFSPQVLSEMDWQLVGGRQRAGSDRRNPCPHRTCRSRVSLPALRRIGYHRFDAYQVAPNWPLFDALKERVANYQQGWESLHPDGKAVNPGGYRKAAHTFQHRLAQQSPVDESCRSTL